MWGKLSLLTFFISLLSLTVLSSGTSIPGISTSVLFYLGVVSFGILGFVTSILSNFFDKKKRRVNTTKSLIFYVGMILVFAGLMFRFMHWPYSRFLLFGGIIVSSISFFISKQKDKDDEELLDSDL